jgi:geranylgeranyl pyrophosphate synthase
LKTRQDLREIVPELEYVDKFIIEMFQSRSDTIGSLKPFLVQMKGKKFRPALFLTCARMHHGRDLQSIIPIAVSLELIHTATLLHDDVLDNARLRRSRPTVNTLWGNQVAVLLGDYLFSRALTLLTTFGNLEIIELMVNVIEEMSIGEIQQQLEASNPDLTEEEYLERIKQKTAVFMASCCLAGCLASKTSMEIKSSVYKYGLNLGMAYQVIDDVLDFSGQEKNTGKDTCSDLKNGIITLPLIYTLQFSPIKDEIFSWIREQRLGESELFIILNEIKLQGGIEYSIKTAERYIDKALTCLEAIPTEDVQNGLKAVTRLVLRKVPII